MKRTFRGARDQIVVGGVAVLFGVAAIPSAGAQMAERGLGIDTMNLDRSVRPQDDFYRYVNGGWLKRATIPSDASSTGAFRQLSDRSRDELHAILEDASHGSARPGSEERKVGDLYASYMDTARVEQLGLTPLRGELARITALRSPADLPATFAHYARLGVQGPAGVGVGQDPKRSSVNVLLVGQSGLGLPDRDYYLKDDAKTVATRTAYAEYLTRLLTLAGHPEPAAAAGRVLALETSLARSQWDRARSRDRNATYNMMTATQLAALTPAYSWPSYLEAAGLGAATDVVVRQPDYLMALNAVILATPIATWRDYLTVKLLDSYAPELPSAFGTARFAFRGRTLSGQQEQAVLWKRAVDGTERILGEPAGKLYVARYFKPEAKARMDKLVQNIRAAYRVGIDSLEWMSPATKTQAQDKLAHFTVKIGYPDVPRDYSALVIRRDDLLGNAVRSAAFQYSDMTSRLGHPVNRTRWSMNPQTVNAYYNSSNNEIVFPAAILQPPFFDVNADDAVNYGAIGAVIGHEIGHGFDDQGRKSDGEGNLRDWWTEGDAKAFDARTARLGAQYDAIVPIDGIHINSKLTMGENIGDLSGLAQAYRAYRISLGGHEAPVIDGFTGDQRFFMGFAQIWRSKDRDEALRQQLLTNPHSPGTARGFVPLVNNDAFQRAFNIQPGDRMYLAPADRVRIW
jgi:putative endopeptidase